MAYVIGDDCVMCGACQAQCPADAISEGDGKYVINADACISCGVIAILLFYSKCMNWGLEGPESETTIDEKKSHK